MPVRFFGRFNDAEPVAVWQGFQDGPLVYEPRSFTDRHGGHPKEQLLAQDGWDALLVEGGLQNSPYQHQGQTIGGRAQIECEGSPNEYLAGLDFRGEIGLTPEAYIIRFLDALERQGQVLDTDTHSYLPGVYLPLTGTVPGVYWDAWNGVASLGGYHPDSRHSCRSARAAVRVV